jgi:hypothetical protein
MKGNDELSAQKREGAAGEEATTGAGDERHTPRKLTFAENALLTVKVLLGAGLMLVALWGLNLWISPS